MKQFQLMFWSVTILIATTTASLFAAPIGVPGATAGANKSEVGAEINFVFDRDLASPGGTAESTQVFAKGDLGLTDRVDLIIRLGFGQFETKDVPGGKIDTDIGPAFGVGFKTTWAQIPDAGLKIGSVLQTVRLRAKDGDTRFAWSEYDAALGIYLDSGRSPRAGQAALLPYGGIVWSGLDINGAGVEDETFGIFLGIVARLAGNLHVGIELRIPDQTSLGINAGFSF